MARRFALCCLLAACSILLTMSPVSAAEGVLTFVPDSAWGIVVINQPAALGAKIEAVTRQMELPIPELLTILKQEANLRENVEANEPAALLILPPKRPLAAPTLVLLIPVCDYNKFVTQAGGEVLGLPVSRIRLSNGGVSVRKIGRYAAMTSLDDRYILERDLKVSADIPASLAPWQEWMTTQDVAAIILQPGMKHLLISIREEIQRQKTSLEQRFDPVRAAAGVFDVYAKICEISEKEVTSIGIGLRLDEQNGIQVVCRAALAPGGEWDRIVALLQPPKERLLTGLLAGPFIMAGGIGGGVFGEELWEIVVRFSSELFKNMRDLYMLNDEQIERLANNTRRWRMEGVRDFSLVLGPEDASGAMLSGMVAVMHVERSAAFMTRYQESMKEFQELAQQLKSPMLRGAEIYSSQVNGIPAVQVVMTPQSLPGGLSGTAQNSMLEVWTGPSKRIVGWVVPADDRTVVIGYFNKGYLQRTIQAMKERRPALTADPGVAKVSRLLPSGAFAVGYTSPAGLIHLAKRLPPIDPTTAEVMRKLPRFPETPPMGFALTTASHEISSHWVVPQEVLMAIRQYVEKVKAMQPNTGTTRTP
jgi:hypothetical protein